MTFHLNTPEAQAAREQFKQNAAAKQEAIKSAPRLSAPTKPEDPARPERVPFKGAGK